MNEAIYFKSSLFDVSTEDKNPINPIYGQSLLLWLKDKLAGEIEVNGPEPEDWGWYSYVTMEGREYLVGAIAYFEEGDDPRVELDWTFQVSKIRSFLEKLFGKEKMTVNDPCFVFFKELFESEPGFNSVEIN